jgi:hypothetical protein
MLKYVGFYRLFFSMNAPEHPHVNPISMAILLLLELSDWKNSTTFSFAAFRDAAFKDPTSNSFNQILCRHGLLNCQKIV